VNRFEAELDRLSELIEGSGSAKQFAQMLTRISTPSAPTMIRMRLGIGAEFELKNLQVRR